MVNDDEQLMIKSKFSKIKYQLNFSCSSDQFEALQEELDRRRQECLQLKVYLYYYCSRTLFLGQCWYFPVGKKAIKRAFLLRRCQQMSSWREVQVHHHCLERNQRQRNFFRLTKLKRRQISACFKASLMNVKDFAHQKLLFNWVVGPGCFIQHWHW